MNYPHDVPSVLNIHPHLANNADIHNVQALHGLTVPYQAGTPLNPDAVIDAESTVEVLLGAKRKHILFRHIHN